MIMDDNIHRTLGHARSALNRSHNQIILTHYLDESGIRRGIVKHNDHITWSESHVLTAHEIYRAIMVEA